MWWHTCNPSTRELEVGGSQIQGQPRLCSETVSKERDRETEIEEIEIIPMYSKYCTTVTTVFNAKS